MVTKGSIATAQALLKEERIRITEEEKKKIMEELKKATSPERARDEPHVLAYYRGGAFGAGKAFSHRIPDIVVFPKSKEEVREILRIATEYAIPVTPVGRQTTLVAGRPLNGGIVLDFMGMKKIHKVDTEHGYVVVEPGVTLHELIETIRPKGYTVAMGSYFTSFPVIAPLVNWGAMHNFTNRMSDQVIGLEMVTPDGSILYTGTMLLRDCEHWTDVQNCSVHLTNLFSPHYGTLGVITRAAIRIWPLLEKTALPIFGFDNFEAAFRWTHAMAKSSMVDQAMVWNWVLCAITDCRRTVGYLDYMEDRMRCQQDEAPKEMGLYNCYAWAQMRGYKEEIEGALKTANRLARQYGGKYLPEKELEEKLPNLLKYFLGSHKEFRQNEERGVGVGPETAGGATTQFTGTVEEIIKLYKGLVEKFKEFGFKNWCYYTRMYNSGQTPWFRFFPALAPTTQEDQKEVFQLRNEVTKFALENYNVNLMLDPFIYNDPENPEKVKARQEPIRRLLSAVQREFDPQGIMTPIMKKYTLL